MADTSTEGVHDVPRITTIDTTDNSSKFVRAAQEAYPIGPAKTPSSATVDAGAPSQRGENTDVAVKEPAPKAPALSASAENPVAKPLAPDASNAIYPDPYGRGPAYGKSGDNITSGKYRNSDADIINNANDLQALTDKHHHWYSSITNEDQSKIDKDKVQADVDTYKITNDARFLVAASTASDINADRLSLLNELTSTTPEVAAARARDLVNLGIATATFGQDRSLTDLKITGVTDVEGLGFSDSPGIYNLPRTIDVNLQTQTIDGVSKTQLQANAIKGLADYASDFAASPKNMGIFAGADYSALRSQAQRDISRINAYLLPANNAANPEAQDRARYDLLSQFAISDPATLAGQVKDLVNLGMAKVTSYKADGETPAAFEITSTQDGTAIAPLDIDLKAMTVDGIKGDGLARIGDASDARLASQLLQDAAQVNSDSFAAWRFNDEINTMVNSTRVGAIEMAIEKQGGVLTESTSLTASSPDSATFTTDYTVTTPEGQTATQSTETTNSLGHGMTVKGSRITGTDQADPNSPEAQPVEQRISAAIMAAVDKLPNLSANAHKLVQEVIAPEVGANGAYGSMSDLAKSLLANPVDGKAAINAINQFIPNKLLSISNGQFTIQDGPDKVVYDGQGNIVDGNYGKDSLKTPGFFSFQSTIDQVNDERGKVLEDVSYQINKYMTENPNSVANK